MVRCMSYPPVPPPPPPPGFPPGQNPPYSYGAPMPAKAPGMAVASMVLGILSVTIGLCLWFLPALPILAVVFGHIALSKIAAQRLPGRGMALTGLITGYVGLGISALILILNLVGLFTSPSPVF
jgi:hypothetical protein